jgi:hypothetical protein
MKQLNKWIIPFSGTVLFGLATWMLVTLVELQTLVYMIQNELMNIDKVIGRIYAHMDRLAN